MSQTHAVAAPSAAPPAAKTAPTTDQRPSASTRPAAGSEFGRVAFERAFADPARPVHGAVRASVEAATGVSLAGVRVHTGPRVRTAARAARAAAFTLGRDIGIAVGPGQAVPDALLTHELIHAAQQSGDGDAAPADAEAQAHHGAYDLHALGPLRGTGTPYVAFAAEDWMHGTPDIRHYSFTELVDELRAVDEWLNRQIVGSQETDRMMEAKDALQAEIARRQAAIRAADRPAPRRRGRGRAAQAQPQPELPEQTEMPRVLRERTSTQLTDPAEIRAEVDRITAWLQRPDLSRADRSILRQELASLEPGFGAELGRASAQRQQQRLARALSPGDGADEAAVLANIRLIESIRPYQEQPGMAYVMHDGELLVFPQELADRVRAEVTAALQEAARRARDMNDSTEYRMSEHLRLNYEDQYVVGFFVSLVSGEEPVDLQRRMLGPMADSNVALSRYRTAQQRGSLSEMADAVFTAVTKADQAQTIVLNGIDRAIAAAGAIVTGLTITRNLAFAVALSIGAILAAPVVAAGVAGTGATGLLATGMTAVGTGTVVGGEGFLLGFAGGAGGELVAGHGGGAALRTGLSEGRRVGEQGFAIGVGGGASLGLARNLGVGAAGLTRGGQLWRGALAGGGGNALGSMTGAALSDVPEGESRAGFVLRSGAWGAGLGMFGGAAGTGSQWLSNPAARYGVGVGLPSLAGAGGTYLQTGGDWSQTLQAGALGLTVGALASRQPTGVTPTQQRAFQLGQGFMRTTRTYAGALMIGLSNVGPSVRMGESPTPTMITVRDSEAGFVQQAQAPTQQQAPVRQAQVQQAQVQQQAPVQQAPGQQQTVVQQAPVQQPPAPVPAQQQVVGSAVAQQAQQSVVTVTAQTRTVQVANPALVARYEQLANDRLPAIVTQTVAAERPTATRARLAQLRADFDALRAEVGGAPSLTPQQRARANAILREARDLARDDFGGLQRKVMRRLRADPDLQTIEGQLVAAGDAQLNPTGTLRIRVIRPDGTSVFEPLNLEHRVRLSDNPWLAKGSRNLILTDAPQNQQYLEAVRQQGSVWPTDPVEEFVVRHQLNDEGIDFSPGTR